MTRPRLIGLLLGAVAFVALVVVGLVAAATYVDRQNALAEHEAASTELLAIVDETADALAEADEVLAVAADPLVPADPVAELTTRRDAVAAESAQGGELLARGVDDLGADDIRSLTAELEAAARDLALDDTGVLATAAAVLTAAQATSADVEAENFDAENAPHIVFRATAADLADARDDDLADARDDDLAETLAAYLASAHALEASHDAELAEKRGPLFDARMAVQRFARSIAGGVLLEFDWRQTVNGYGSNGSYGGTSRWNAADGGYATITLSNSVAEQWPGAGVKALVAHEVGHAILSRCYALFYDSEFYRDEEESWATAWAIGLGHTADGSGESIYGRPPAGLIALSRECR